MNDTYQRHWKRVVDVVGAGAVLTVLSPAMALTAVAIRRETTGPALFKQERIGLDGRPFEILKFRTMFTLGDSHDADGQLMENYARVTRVGRVLRNTSMDELPQLINVLRGDMSIIGPRPTLAYQVERYTDEQRGRLSVRPGLTGLAQVNGRNNLTWEQKIQWDLAYVADISFLGDVKIVLRTIGTLVRREGVAFAKYDSLSQHGAETYATHV